MYVDNSQKYRISIQTHFRGALTGKVTSVCTTTTVALMNNDLRRLPFLVKLSRSTRAVINQNFAFGTLFIIGGLTLASLGYLHPIMAAFLHVTGSLIVVFNSARLVRKGEELEHFHPEPDKTPHTVSGQLTPKMA